MNHIFILDGVWIIGIIDFRLPFREENSTVKERGTRSLEAPDLKIRSTLMLKSVRL